MNYHIFSANQGGQRGNVMVYILIAIALFGALTLILSAQNEQSEGRSVSDEQLAFYVNDLLNYSSTAQNVINQMQIAGSEINDLVFTMPSAASFNTAPNLHKVYHPTGGGLNYQTPNNAIFTGTATNPVKGWYMGRFTNIAGTSAHDVILTAYQISQPVCAALNKKITGSDVIPAIAGTGNLQTYLIAQADSGIANAEFTSAICPGSACAGKTNFCVSNGAGTMWAFYSILAAQ